MAWCARERRNLAAERPQTGRTYRLMNEIPTLLMVAIVSAVIVKF